MDAACETSDTGRTTQASVSLDVTDGANNRPQSAFKDDRPSIKIRFGELGADGGTYQR